MKTNKWEFSPKPHTLYPIPKHLYLLLVLTLSFTFLTCTTEVSGTSSGGGGGGGSGAVFESGAIPSEIYEEFVNYMPIYEGISPPDISGEYLASTLVLVNSNLSGDSPGSTFIDLYFAFIKDSDGKLKFMSRQESVTYSSDDVTVEIVGENNNFTAYFVVTANDGGVYSKQSTIISGTLTSEGIRNFHYSFVMLDKWNNPNGDNFVPINTYRVIKENDGLAERYKWID